MGFPLSRPIPASPSHITFKSPPLLSDVAYKGKITFADYSLIEKAAINGSLKPSVESHFLGKSD